MSGDTYICDIYEFRIIAQFDEFMSRDDRMTQEIISFRIGIFFVLRWTSKARASSAVRDTTGSRTVAANDPRNSGCQTHNINTESSTY